MSKPQPDDAPPPQPESTAAAAVAPSKGSASADPGPNPANWLKATLPVAMIAAFAELGYAILNNSALPVYMKNGLGLQTVIYTLVMMPFFISEAIFKSPFGVLADRWGRKPLMVIGPAVSIVTPLLLISIHYPTHVVAVPMLLAFGFLRLLDGLGAAALWPALFAYVGDHVHRDKRASAMSLLNVTYMIGLAFGFLAGGWADDTFGPVLSGEASLRSALVGISHQVGSHLRHLGRQGAHLHVHVLEIQAKAAGITVPVYRAAHYHPSFYLGSVLFALATIVALLALKDRAADRKEGIEEHAVEEAHTEHVTWETFVAALKTVPNLLLIATTTFLGIGCIALLVKLFALAELNVSETEFGKLVLWPAVVIGSLAIPLGHLSDRFGKVRSVRAGYFVAAVGMWTIVGLFQAPDLRYIGLIIGGTLLGLGFVAAFPAWMALLTMMGSESRRGTIVGAVSTAQGVGTLLGTAIGGWLYDNASSNPHTAHIAPFEASAVLLSLSFVLTCLMIRGDHLEEKPAD